MTLSPRLVRWGPVILVGVVVAMQLVPYRIENPPVVSHMTWNSPRTHALADAACSDCHSNHTRRPAYSHVAPVSWWLKGHVDEGRAALNFDDCRSSRGERESSRDAAETVVEGSMPPSYYTWFGLHPSARLSAADKRILAEGLRLSLTASGC